MFRKVSQNSQENTCAGVSTYQFNLQSMGRADKRRGNHWRCRTSEEHLPVSINERHQEAHPLLGKKKESYLVNLC